MKRARSIGLGRKVLATAGFVALLLVPMSLEALSLSAKLPFKPKYLALLPPYCKYTQIFRAHVKGGNDLDQIKRWYRIFGGRFPVYGLFHAMHHYCWGLMDVNYAKFWALSKHEKLFYWRESIGEFDYVLRRAKPTDAILPEILTKKGESLIAVGEGTLAVGVFLRTMELKADYWPAYADLSDYYKSVGELDMARKTLEKGLSYAPGATALRRRLAELDSAKGKHRPAPTRNPR